jgi:hypothetical protein
MGKENIRILKSGNYKGKKSSKKKSKKKSNKNDMSSEEMRKLLSSDTELVQHNTKYQNMNTQPISNQMPGQMPAQMNQMPAQMNQMPAQMNQMQAQMQAQMQGHMPAQMQGHMGMPGQMDQMTHQMQQMGMSEQMGQQFMGQQPTQPDNFDILMANDFAPIASHQQTTAFPTQEQIGGRNLSKKIRNLKFLGMNKFIIK